MVAWPSWLSASASSPCELRPASSAYNINCASSWLRRVMPCCAVSPALNLMSKPIFRTPANFGDGRSALRASSDLILIGRRGQRRTIQPRRRTVCGRAGHRRRHSAPAPARSADVGLHRIVRTGLRSTRNGLFRAPSRSTRLSVSTLRIIFWYLLRSTGVFRAASARAAESACGVRGLSTWARPLAACCALPLRLRGRGGVGAL